MPDIQNLNQTSLQNKEKTLDDDKSSMTAPDYMVAFSGNSQSYCVGMVDIVNSTKISHTLDMYKMSKYYKIFINSISKVLSRFGGCVVKNMGDSLLYYFPESSKTESKYGITSCLEASFAIIQEHVSINEYLQNENLPQIDYRVSADYGMVVLMNTNDSTSLDIIGPPVNMVSKINRSAAVNGIVFGSDLYEISKDLNEYKFKRIGEYSIGLKNSYPLYSIFRK
ncbi:MAG TPA: adenylate/guanylate cyclase domain-containing protein [Nitrosopumilaceae archaeon]|jgi:adenylate cyclase|nr:adenylate/guanylate cyclase domain-containing protein [Nitrosopumilaceae archaeon]